VRAAQLKERYIEDEESNLVLLQHNGLTHIVMRATALNEKDRDDLKLLKWCSERLSRAVERIGSIRNQTHEEELDSQIFDILSK